MTVLSVFDNMPIPYPKRKFLWDDEGKDDKDKVINLSYIQKIRLGGREGGGGIRFLFKRLGGT